MTLALEVTHLVDADVTARAGVLTLVNVWNGRLKHLIFNIEHKQFMVVTFGTVVLFVLRL